MSRIKSLRKKVSAFEAKAGAKSKYILNPEWESSDEAKAEKEAIKEAMFSNPLVQMHEIEDCFPEDYGKELPESGAWIRINKVPATEYTVPPFSMWRASRWYLDANSLGVTQKRVKIITPKGDLGIWPHEYCIVPDITRWLGEEHVYMRMLGEGAESGINPDQLFYIRSRGVPRREAERMLFTQITSQAYCWFEVHPAYGRLLGLDWPNKTHCPFAMDDYTGPIKPVQLGKLVRIKKGKKEIVSEVKQ